jgi:RNA polymerase sigma-70 factor (ECF subfamily)
MPNEPIARALVERALQQDESAARELVQQLYPLVVRMVRAHRPQRAAEEDLCQMIFIKLFQKLDQFSGTVPLEHWVSRIAINTCINQIRAEKARPELRHADLSEEQAAMVSTLGGPNEDMAPDRALIARDLVEKLLATLKPAERIVIDLLYLQEKSVAEIREITGWSAALVKIRAYRARQKLKTQLAAFESQEAYGRA